MAFLVAKDAIRLRLVRIQTAAGDKHIQPAIVIQVNQPAAPAAHIPAQPEDAAAGACVFKGAVAVIGKYLEGFATQSRHHDVRPSVSVDVTEVRTHAGDLAAVAVVGNAGFDAGLLHLSAAHIANQQIRRMVVGDEKTGPSAAVEVGKRHPHAFAKNVAESRCA